MSRKMAGDENILLKKLHIVRAFVPSGSTDVTLGEEFL